MKIKMTPFRWVVAILFAVLIALALVATAWFGAMNAAVFLVANLIVWGQTDEIEDLKAKLKAKGP